MFPDTVYYVQKFPYSIFATAATSNAVNFISVPIMGEVLSSFISVNQAFSGGSIATYTLSLGKSTDTDSLILASTATSAGIISGKGVDFDDNGTIYSNSATTQLQVRAVSSGANLNAATQGHATIYTLIAIHR